MDDLERDVFLGVLIKYLVEEKGYKIKNAWKAVCVDSREIAYFRDFKDKDHRFADTGSRALGEWSDLGNTLKIIRKRNSDSFYVSGNYYKYKGSNLANIIDLSLPFDDCEISVGELVMNE